MGYGSKSVNSVLKMLATALEKITNYKRVIFLSKKRYRMKIKNIIAIVLELLKLLLQFLVFLLKRWLGNIHEDARKT